MSTENALSTGACYQPSNLKSYSESEALIALINLFADILGFSNVKLEWAVSEFYKMFWQKLHIFILLKLNN